MEGFKKTALFQAIIWYARFFERDSDQSMTRLISWKITISATVYLFITLDWVGAGALYTGAGAVKITGKKLTEKKTILKS